MRTSAMPAAALRDTLRQMIAVLEAERQALAGLDLEGILGTAADKNALCGRLGESGAEAIDEECRAMLEAAKRLNEVNRQVRNLIAANVSSRLDALTGSPALYRAAGTNPRAAYSYAART
jgi:hypothetical protein